MCLRAQPAHMEKSHAVKGTNGMLKYITFVKIPGHLSFATQLILHGVESSPPTTEWITEKQDMGKKELMYTVSL